MLLKGSKSFLLMLIAAFIGLNALLFTCMKGLKFLRSPAGSVNLLLILISLMAIIFLYRRRLKIKKLGS